jgi:hypothetical protein
MSGRSSLATNVRLWHKAEIATLLNDAPDARRGAADRGEHRQAAGVESKQNGRGLTPAVCLER